MTTAVIVDAVRTASGRGKPGGALAEVHPVDLLATVLRALVERSRLDPALVDDVIAGCLSQTGEQSVNIARNAVLAAGFPESVPATTIDRQCGSSQQAAAFAAQGVIAGAYDVVIACGVERMSSNPIGAATLGLDPYGAAVAERYPDGLIGQGISAELIAARWGFGREELDAYAARSHRLAAASDFSRDIVPVATPHGEHRVDETVRPGTTVDALAALPPAFRDDRLRARFPELDWRITAGNSSPLTDGASAVLIMSEEKAALLGLEPRARFTGFAVTGSDPIEMLTGVIPVTRRILARSGVGIDDLDTIEVNEAFACVPLAWLAELHADPERVNPRGGAIALGHPLGASGTRLLGTMLGTLEQTGGLRGLQVMCEGGGMANATLIERY
ncbi:thiolase family protein [Galbitalea soli]|uniref:Thiolase family protein n=1 Tax=Galbitalea soli TaxID=1268042 RepID=A0A7C9TP24_9MICO|nr:thiolase family protein [Galbitalea soli]NEM89782.1 thiolase family protein [Galbitalea soli]NYJ30485.1 acetyl-CoA acyltransferase [Galbitalea soli]